MSRPCYCENVRIGSAYTTDQCRLCWLYHHREDYRALWDSSDFGLLENSNPKAAKCKYRGSHIREEECKACRGHVRIKIFACEIHQTCSIAKPIAGAHCCAECTEYESEKDSLNPVSASI